MKTNRHARFLAIAAAALLTACGGGEPDPHYAPREAKPYESVDVGALSQAQLLDRLELLATETAGSIAREEFVEFHHLEVAMTATLNALEPAAQENPQARASIATLKNLAEQLHVAGHDSNGGMAAKLAPEIARLSQTILDELR